MLTHIVFFILGFLAALLCVMIIICCEAERSERKSKDKDKEKKDE